MRAGEDRLFVIKQSENDSKRHDSTTATEVHARIDNAAAGFGAQGVTVHILGGEDDPAGCWGEWVKQAAHVYGISKLAYVAVLNMIFALAMFVVHNVEVGSKLWPPQAHNTSDCYRTEHTENAVNSSARACCATMAHAVAHMKAGFSLNRPPGHHAMEGDARGFCWRNNALLTVVFFSGLVRHFGYTDDLRICLFDIDFHHGMGIELIAISDAFAQRLRANISGRVEILYYSVFRKNGFDSEQPQTTHTAATIRGNWGRKAYYVQRRYSSTTRQWGREQSAARLVEIRQQLREYTSSGFNAVVVAAGFDHCVGERIVVPDSQQEQARLWTLDEMRDIGRSVGESARQCRLLKVPVSVLEGGYQPETMRTFLPAYAMCSAEL